MGRACGVLLRGMHLIKKQVFALVTEVAALEEGNNNGMICMYEFVKEDVW